MQANQEEQEGDAARMVATVQQLEGMLMPGQATPAFDFVVRDGVEAVSAGQDSQDIAKR